MARDRIPVKRPIVGALIPTRLRFTIRELLPPQCSKKYLEKTSEDRNVE